MKEKIAIVFGETKFSTACINHLLEKKWSVAYVVTRDEYVIQWCKNFNIKAISIEQISSIEILNSYVFSIINPYIIPDTFLKKINPIKSINYHDSLLPKYAGLNSTTWAILNEEYVHGVTWQEIVKGIDEGNIYYQQEVPVNADETVYELNIRCTEAALDGFVKIINDIENNFLNGITQNLSQKTYYGMNSIPKNYGYLNSEYDSSELNKIINALSFGKGYKNPVATPKIKVGSNHYILEKPWSNGYKANSFNYEILNIYGRSIRNPIALKDSDKYSLADKQHLYFQKIKQKELHSYDGLQKILTSLESSCGLFYSHVDCEERYNQKVSIKISLEKLSLYLSIILSRLNINNTFVKIYSGNDFPNDALIRETIDEIKILPLKIDALNLSIAELSGEINNSFVKNKFSITKDFSYRYGVDLCSDIVITENYNSDIDKHRIEFSIVQDELSIKHYRVDQDFVNMIVKCIEILDSKLKCINSCALLKVKEIALLSTVDITKLTSNFSKETLLYENNKTIQALFEEQARKTSENIALVYEDKRLTYQELNDRANQLANYLREREEIKPDDLIALCLERSEHMVVAILGVLKAGAAYVPMEPSYPEERIRYILEDTKAKLVLTNENYQTKLEALGPQSNVISIDSAVLINTLKKNATTTPNTITNSQHLAYVIYTSGTTGKPKGVLQQHNNVERLLNATNEWYQFNKEDVWTLFHSYVFDFSVWELWGALLYGGKLVVPSYEQTRDLNLFYDLCKEEEVTVLNQTPSAFYQFMDIALKQTEQLSRLKYVIFGGEALNIAQLKPWFEFYGDKQPRLINMYGITETTVHVTYKALRKEEVGESSYIGELIPDMRAYVLDSDLNLLPIGAVGELYVGGAGLARGYLNREELTAERFITNPFQSEEEKKENRNSRLYKTGDLVRWLSDGNLEYIGRNDFQVKIRGYRIELGEIENALASYAGIKQAAVLAREHVGVDGSSTGNKYLVGYYVSEDELNETSIIEHLSNCLPEYMVPSALVFMERFPLTVNGKLDQRALPAPVFTKEENYVGPRTDLEKKVCQLWAEVLNLPEDTISIEDDFFRSGGDSILSIQLISQLRQVLGIQVSVKDLLGYKTIQSLSDNVLSKKRDAIKYQTEQGNLQGSLELLPIQKWFFTQELSNINHWNQSFLIKVPPLNVEKLQNCLKKLIQQHDAFNLRYKYQDENKTIKPQNEIDQYYDNHSKVETLKILDLSTIRSQYDEVGCKLRLQEIFTTWQSNFNIEHGPIYSVGYVFGYPDGSARLYFAFHHLMVDSISWRIICEDLQKIYYEIPLSEKSSSYRQWTQRIKDYKSICRNEESIYWDNVIHDLEDSQKSLENLIDQEDAQNYNEFTLNENSTKALISSCNHAYNTQINDLLLTALGLALSRLTQRKTNHIVLEGHGREEIFEDIDFTKTVGWFTTMYPVRLDMAEYKDIKNNIISIKETIHKIPNKGIGYGILKSYEKDFMPRISFNYLGQFDKDSCQDKEIWNIVDEESGVKISYKNIDHNILNIMGHVLNDTLRFKIVSKLSNENLEKFVKLFEISLSEVIEHTSSLKRQYLTATDMDEVINQQWLDELQKNRNIEGVYLANSLQQGFVYHALKQGYNDDAYRVQVMWDYENPLNSDLLQKAWQFAVKKYPSLRLRFSWEDEIIQVIDQEVSLDWRYIDLSDVQDKISIENSIKEIQCKDRLESYSLSKGSLFRIYLIKQSNDLYTCIFSNHHAILDGWSNPVLLKYVHETYQKLKTKSKIEIQYSSDFSYIQTQKYLQKNSNENEDYWKRYVESISSTTDLTGLLKQGRKSIKINEYRHIEDLKRINTTISDVEYRSLKEFSKVNGVTLNAIFQYLWHKILSIYTGTQQTVVGVTVSGRNLPIDNILQSVGLYINTLPLIVDHAQNPIVSVIDEIKKLQNSINEINDKSNINLSKLQKSEQSLFDSLFIFENYPNDILKTNHTDIKISKWEIIEKLDYPLSVLLTEDETSITFEIQYAAEIFDSSIMSFMLKAVQHLLEETLKNPNKKVRSISYLNKDESSKILHSWNNTVKAYPHEMSIHGLFELQAKKFPNNIAIIYEDIQLTYQEVDKRANQLAYLLVSQYNIISGDLIAICLDRSEHMLITILGILKAGAAYVPIDPGYPEDRIAYILDDTKAKVIFANAKYSQQINKINVDFKSDKNSTAVLIIDDVSLQQKLNSLSSVITLPAVSSNSLAHVIYTSGTTGKPKGVLSEHTGVVNLIYWLNDMYPLTSSDKFLQKTTYVFDDSVYEFFWPLVCGASVVFAKPEGHKDPDYIIKLIQKEEINATNFVPSMLSVFLDSLQLMKDKENFSKTELLPSLRYLFSSGEALSLHQVRQCHELLVNTEIHNLYGPTEASVDVLYYPCVDKDIQAIYIGKQIYNTTAYVLDNHLNPLPIGAIGELYIGGVGLARGYLNREELTAERFIVNPFQSEEEKKENRNSRLYKTGDLVRWLWDGNIEYIGRNDFQVKIRGHRIELGEIETALANYAGVKQAAVLAREHVAVDGTPTGNKYLVGYYVAEGELNESAILAHLSGCLPEYMVPSALVSMERFPLTVNGKLDQRALPAPVFTKEESYVSPRTELEKKMCQLWAEVLGLPGELVGITDNFFALGGNSILAIKLTSKLNRALSSLLSQAFTVSNIFKYTSIAKLVGYLENPEEEVVQIERQTVEVEQQTLSFAQERLWFIEQYEGGSNAYNIPLVYRLGEETDIDLLEKSIGSLVERHEVLRTVIAEDGEGNSYQRLLDVNAEPLSIERRTVKNVKELKVALSQDVNHIFDLSRDYPIRVNVYERSSKECYLSIVIHHIAFDGWSIDILMEELEAYYEYYKRRALGEEAALNLNPLSIQYKDFALWQRSYLQGAVLEKQLSYWKGKLAGYESLNLLTDNLRPSELDYRGEDVSFTIDEETSRGLRELAKACQVSLYSVLLSGYYLLLRSFTNQNDLIIGTPVSNRHYEQVEGLIGFFVNTLAIRSIVNPKKSIKEYIKHLGGEIISAQLHQDLPFEKLVDEMKVEKDRSRHPLFQVVFGVQSFEARLTSGILESYKEDMGYKIAKFDLTTMIDDSEEALKGVFNYATSLYEQETIERFIETYQIILQQLAHLSDKDRKIEELTYLTPTMYKQIITDWNATEKEYPSDKTIHGLFEEQVRKTPDNIAVVDNDDNQYTYERLYSDYDILSSYLHQEVNSSTSEASLIAVLSEKGYPQLVSTLSIMRTGHGYLPLNITWPVGRLDEILTQGNVSTVLISQACYDDAQIRGGLEQKYRLVIIEEILARGSNPISTSFPKIHPDNIAYVIFTSGSTGKPKGVTINHQGAVNTLLAVNERFNVSEQDKVLALSELSFDLSVYDMFGLLAVGGCVVFPQQALTKTPEHWIELIERNAITLWNTVPQLAALLMEELESTNNLCQSLRVFLLSGDWIPLNLPTKIKNYCKEASVTSLGGATEGSIWSIWYEINEVEKNWSSIPYGRGMPNQKMYVLNHDMAPSSVGVLGEIYIGGIGVACNYWGDAGKTQERFIHHNDLGRLYKTGDLGRWNRGGYIEFMGREDNQVKIHGYRIELEEISAKVVSLFDVDDAVTLVYEKERLVLYYSRESALDEEFIKTSLKAYFPDYMLPQAIVHLQEFPLTVNGKLDQRALPSPVFTKEESYVPPRTELEKKMCQLWAEVLGLPEELVGITDNFFGLGGNSILAIKLTSKLNKDLRNVSDNTFSVADIFQYNTISSLIKVLNSMVVNVLEGEI